MIGIPIDRHKSKGGRLSNFLKRNFQTFLFIFLVVFFLQWLTRFFWFYPLTVENNAMSPTLKEGNRIFVLHPHLANIKKNDIVILNLKENNYQLLCRVIASEGERIEIIEGQIFINGRSQSNSIKVQNPIPEAISYQDNISVTDVHSNHFFCLNDNRSIVTDSRQWGTFSNEQVVGKVIFKGFLGFGIPR